MSFKDLAHELLLTFSNKKSLLSSKRIERFAAFSTMLLATIIYLGYHIFACTLTSTDLVMITGVWLGYGGFNTIQNRKDKQNGEENNNTSDTV